MFSNVECFCSRFSSQVNFSTVRINKLQEEFTQYQLLERSAIPDMIWTQALIRDEGEGGDKVEYYKMDVVWAYLKTLIVLLLLSCYLKLPG